MNRDDKQVGWYFKKDGQSFGPFSPLELRELAASGKITPRQAVWKQKRDGLIFVVVATAIKEMELSRP